MFVKENSLMFKLLNFILDAPLIIQKWKQRNSEYYKESTQPKGSIPWTYTKALEEFGKNGDIVKENDRDEVHS